MNIEKHPALDILARDEEAMALPAATRTRILRQTMAARRGTPAAEGRFRPLFALQATAWAAPLTVALMLVGAGYLWRPAETPVPGAASPGLIAALPDAEGPRDLRIEEVNGSVVLEWENGGGAHTVRRATDVRDLRTAPGVQVAGNRFEDRNLGASQVVLYVVD